MHNNETFIPIVYSENRYRDNAIRLSDVYRDRIASALDTAVYWAEYVIKHHGAPHLSYAGKDLYWPQQYCMDIFAILGLIVLLGLYFLLKIYWSCKSKRGVKDGKKDN